MKVRDGMIIERERDGSQFIATDAAHWAVRLDAWRKGDIGAEPMPIDHMMFQRPIDYGCVCIIR